MKRLSKIAASELESIGVLLFLLVAWSGVYIGGAFFINYLHKKYPGETFRLLSAGTIPISNIALGIKVFSSLFMVFIILSTVRVVVNEQSREVVRSKKEES